MLIELAIRDLALIEETSLTFRQGLNVISGETGAGKSLLIGALELLLGRRARTQLIRKGASTARVEGRFLVTGCGSIKGYGASVQAWLEDQLPDVMDELKEDSHKDGSDLPEEPDLELILTRTLTRDGRSRAHVNHRPVTMRLLRELAAQLVEIHGQNDHQRLFEAGEQRSLLDTFGNLNSALAGYRERRAGWLAGVTQLEGFASQEAERLERLDLLRFQLGELSAVAPVPGEFESLQAERDILRHASTLSADLSLLLQSLSEEDGAALERVRMAERKLEEWRSRVPGLDAASASVREACAYLEEVISDLVSFADGVEADPRRQEVVEERLSDLERLAAKYRTDGDGLSRKQVEIAASLEALESAGQDHDELIKGVERAHSGLCEAAERLRAARVEVIPRLVEAVKKGLRELGLAAAEFDVCLIERGAAGSSGGASESGLTAEPATVGVPFSSDAERQRLGPEGTGDVQFRLAANPGEPRRPLREVASGGEAARIMLALRGALAVEHSTPTLVFDEVDAGVGGRLGPRVAAHLKGLGSLHQVLCVTHLAPIAAQADQHLRVAKSVSDGRTRTTATVLAGVEREYEVAEMISGGGHEGTALAEARRLLGDS